MNSQEAIHKYWFEFVHAVFSRNQTDDFYLFKSWGFLVDDDVLYSVDKKTRKKFLQCLRKHYEKAGFRLGNFVGNIIWEAKIELDEKSEFYYETQIKRLVDNQIYLKESALKLVYKMNEHFKLETF